MNQQPFVLEMQLRCWWEFDGLTAMKTSRAATARGAGRGAGRFIRVIPTAVAFDIPITAVSPCFASAISRLRYLMQL
jgi:hypothetical protein